MSRSSNQPSPYVLHSGVPGSSKVRYWGKPQGPPRGDHAEVSDGAATRRASRDAVIDAVARPEIDVAGAAAPDGVDDGVPGEPVVLPDAVAHRVKQVPVGAGVYVVGTRAPDGVDVIRGGDGCRLGDPAAGGRQAMHDRLVRDEVRF